jgi:hypothetical protein
MLPRFAPLEKRTRCYLTGTLTASRRRLNRRGIGNNAHSTIGGLSAQYLLRTRAQCELPSWQRARTKGLRKPSASHDPYGDDWR